MLHKKDTRYLTSIRDSAHKGHGTGLITITPLDEKCGVFRIRSHSFPKPESVLALQGIFLGLQKMLSFFSTYQVLREMLPML